MNKINFTITKIYTVLVLLLAGLFWQTNLSAQGCPPTPGFPDAPPGCMAPSTVIFTEDFNSSTFGVFTEDPPPAGTTNDLTVSTFSDTPSTGTGPECTAAGIISTNEEFIFLEGSSTLINEVHCMTAMIDLTAQVPGLELSFWYYMFGDNIGELTINVNGNQEFIDGPGQIQTGQFDPWTQGSANLDAYAGQMIALQVCMSEGDGSISTFESDISIDHIQIFSCAAPPPPPPGTCDLVLVSVTPSAGVTCGNTGTIDIIATSTAPPIVYSIGGPVTQTNGTGSFSGLPAGTYTVDVVDADGCATTATVTLEADITPPTITCPPSLNLTCFEGVPAPIDNVADWLAAGGTYTDDCPANGVTFINVNTTNGGDNCPGNGLVVTRTYTVFDEAGNAATCTQTFTYAASTQGPVITSILPTCYKFCASLANPMETDITYTTDCSFDGVVTIAGPVISGGLPNCPGTQYTYTYTVMDNCGRVSSPAQRTFIIGNDGPTIQCPATNLILECGDPNNETYIATHLADVSANTSCELGYTIQDNYNGNPNTTQCLTSTVVTFTVTDDCQRTATCTTIITIEDTTAPEYTSVPPAICDVIECGADANYWYNHWKNYMLDGLAAEDACDSNVNILASNTPLNQNCDANGVAATVVSFTASDNCGNQTTMTGTFIIENTAPAILNDVPADATIECGNPVTFGPAPTVTEQCQTTVTFTDATDDSDPCAVTHTRTWTATDACGGLTTSASQTLTVVDTTPPDAPAPPADQNVQCAADVLPPVDLTATDACDGDITVSPSAVITPGDCDNQFTMVRTWTFVDDCGNQSSVSQTINVDDTTPPDAPAPPADVNVQCAADVPPPVDLTANDNCDGDITVSPSAVITPGDCDNQFTMVRTWTFTDGCGNQSSVSQTINVDDTTPPDAPAPPADVNVQCASDVPAPVDLTANDNCDGDITVSPSAVITPGDCDNQFTMVRIWTFIDGCGNQSSVSQTINVNDTTPPDAPAPPADVNVQCASDVPAPVDLTANDNCDGDITVSPSAVITPGNCDDQFVMVRTWTFTDQCGNQSSVSQTITVNDDTPPNFTFVPADYDSGCISDDNTVTTYAQICASSDDAEEDDENGEMDLTSSDLELTADPSQDKDVKVGLRFKDLHIPAGATITAAWIQFTADATLGIDPVILTVNGEASDDALTFTEEDFNITDRDKTTAVVGWEPGDWMVIGDNHEVERTPDLSSIVQEIVDRAGYTDESALAFIFCGEGKRTGIAYDLNPDQAPEIYVTYEVDPFGTPTATDNCSSVTITHEDTATGDCAGSKTRTWTATDDCGNSATAAQTITFSDNVPPVFTFVPAHVDTSCDDVSFPPTFGTPVAEDNCSDVEITFVEYFDTGDEDSCDEDDEDWDYRREWTATDACGNTTTAVQRFNVKESYATAGFIYTEEEQAVEDVEVSLEGFTGFNAMTLTQSNGTYGFDDLEAGQNYTITPYLNADPLNGVSTFDIVLISKHILQVQQLNSPYKLIAADINNSGSITTMDLVELRKLILLIDDEFQNNTSWRFVEADFVFPQANNPFATVFPETSFINGLVLGSEYDYVAVKVGDVNSSAVANSNAPADTRDVKGELTFVMDDVSLKAGQDYEVIVKAEDFNKLSGYQFTLNFDVSKLELLGMTKGNLPNLNEGNFGWSKVNEGVVMTSWNANEAVTMDADTELFRLTFKAKTEVTLSEALSVSSRYTRAEAYNSDLDLLDVSLRFEGANTATSSKGNALYQNQPNPFKASTVIGFELAEATTATLSIYDVSGRMLKQIEGDFTKGYNEVSVEKTDLQASGIVYYKLVTADFEATKMMMIVK